ncbi:hypothetical protein GGI21_005746, partial [Coemansia aciculifera]
MASSKATSADSKDNRHAGSDAEAQPAQHTPNDSVLDMNGNSLERDLSRVAAWMQNDTRLDSSATHPSRAQRPLQIRLDVAAVERDTDMTTQQTGPAADQPPGLLSHYLQLADIDQQRERLGTRQQRTADDKTRSSSGKTDGSIRQQVRSAFLRGRMARNKDETETDAGSSGGSVSNRVARPESLRVRQPAVDMPLSRICFLDESPGASTSAAAADGHDNSPPLAPPSASVRTTRQQHQRHNLPNLRVPFSETDLTKFLPYALSTPGVQTAIASPNLSRTNSTDDFEDWLKRNGHNLDAAAPSPPQGATDAEAAMLNEKRKRLLEGIHKLLLHQRFLCRLARAMMQFGAPLHHLEDNLSRMARHLCIAATFTTMPGL